jgi:hypothetical protein
MVHPEKCVQWHENGLQLVAEVGGLFSQQDDAPAHFYTIIRTFLDK